MIAICLSTYNGAKFLFEQLQSIENQSQDFFQIVLIVRDDGSTDASLVILQDFINKTSLHVILLDSRINFGPKKSFELLMSKALELDAKYIMFCDQDDVWYKDKIEKTYQKMQDVECSYGQDISILVHSDIIVASEKLQIIAPSFWKYQNINPNNKQLSNFMITNNTTGCSMMINRALAEKTRNIPKEAIMHDWWIAMVASAFGKIAYIAEPLMLYRQHVSNDTGAKQYSLKYFIKKLFEKPSLGKYISQSKAFLNLYGDDLEESQKEMLQKFSSFATLSKWKKIKMLFQYNIWKNGFVRNLGLILFA